MKILVTGGAGFIGSHICDALLEQNHEVEVLDSLIAGVNYTPLGVKLHKTDLLKIKHVTKYERIVHCAARADVSQNWIDYKERETLINTNVLGTENLLESYRGVPVTFISTCAVYGDNLNCQEGEACVATSPYAASKIAGEALVQAYAFESEKPWHVFRLGCAVGSRYHHGHIKDFVDQARKGEIKPLNDGLTQKSYVHVADVCQAVKLAVTGDIGSGVYNIASGAWSPRDTVRAMGCEAIAWWPENKTHGWVGDPMAVAGAARLRSAGWAPTHSIQQGVKDALETLGWKR